MFFRVNAVKTRGFTLVMAQLCALVALHWTSSVNVRFEVLTAVIMKNGVFWDVVPCGSCKNRRFG
jgi:hypothetical protein